MEPIDFTPTRDFDGGNGNHYVAGLGYTATDEKLALLVEEWVAAGLVELGRRTSTLGGVGTVT